MKFFENDFRTAAKLPLYPEIYGALGQYPPLYGTPKAADLITYISICYGPDGPPGKDGYIWYNNKQNCPNPNCIQMDSFKQFIESE